MMLAEIINLTWKEIDLKTGFIRLGKERTKNKTPRVIPLDASGTDLKQYVTRPIQGGFVFGHIRRFNRKAYTIKLSDFTGCQVYI